MNRPAAVEIAYECMRFLITHNPTNATLNKFTEVHLHFFILIFSSIWEDLRIKYCLVLMFIRS